MAIHDDLMGMKLNGNLLPPVETRRFQFTLGCFKKISRDDVSTLIRKSPMKTCALDPLPTWLLAKCHSEINPIITTIINASLNASPIKYFKISFSYTLPKENWAQLDLQKRSYPTLKLISKLIERIVSTQLLDHLSANNALEPM